MDIKDVVERINQLTQKEKLHILNILKKHGMTYTKNSNGYFFNLSDVGEPISQKLCKCLDLIEQNRDVIKEMDRRREELLRYYKGLIEEKLLETVKQRRDEYINLLMERPVTSDLKMNMTPLRKTKRTEYGDDVDPDELMKEYQKSRNKFPKGSIYNMINARLKALRSCRSHERKTDDADRNGAYYGIEETDITENLDDQDSDIENLEERDDVDVDVEADNDYTVSKGHKDDNVSEVKEIVSDIEDAQSEYAASEYINSNEDIDTEYESDDESEKVAAEKKKDSTDEKTENDMSFYRNLLHKQGYHFDENNKCLLVKQEYIS